jgi:hypothetical protein
MSVIECIAYILLSVAAVLMFVVGVFSEKPFKDNK